MAALMHYDSNNKEQNKKEKLKNISKLVHESHDAFTANRKTFVKFREYVYKSTISNEQQEMLLELNRPVLEANIIQAYLSRLIAEFLKNEPSIIVSKGEGANVSYEVLETIENYVRYKMDESGKDFTFYNTYKESLSGGYSVLKVYVDYENEYSFKKTIKIAKCNPLYCGFDQKAKLQTKSDGDFCFEIFILNENEFKEMYPEVNIAHTNSSELDGFKWSYVTQTNKKMVMVCDFYERKKKSIMIYELSNGETVTQQEYMKIQKFWENNMLIEQMPAIKRKRRSISNIICRTRYTANIELEYEETDYKYFPLVFVDGDSVELTTSDDGGTYFMTKPYASTAKGAQDIKNFAMQSVGNFMENYRVDNTVIKEEALPKEQDYLDILKNPQYASIRVVKGYLEDDPNRPIPDPIFNLPPNQLPSEFLQMYNQADVTIQSVLGGFGSNIGNDDVNLSGKAVIEMAALGNSAAMPYVEGMLAAMTQVATIIVDLFPKYIAEERDLPIMTAKGKKDSYNINKNNIRNFNYRDKEINVLINAGANFNIQKNQALKQITGLMAASPKYADFIDEVGLEVLIKNMTIHGQEELMELVPKYQQMKQQQQQQAMQQQQMMMQNDPRMITAQTQQMKAQLEFQIEQQRLQMEAQKMQMDEVQRQFENTMEIASKSIEKILADAKLITAESNASEAQINSAVRLEESETSRANHELDAAVKISEMHERAVNTHKTIKEMHNNLQQQ